MRIRLDGSSIFTFENPSECNYTIEMVAGALGRKGRFNNHSKFHYSVAEHCIHASRLYRRNRKGALMHDAPEYIVGDLITPIKVRTTGFRELEDIVEADMEQRFHYTRPDKESFKVVDTLLYFIEESILFPGIENPYDNIKVDIQCWSAQEASNQFLETYYELSSSL